MIFLIFDDIILTIFIIAIEAVELIALLVAIEPLFPRLELSKPELIKFIIIFG
jgi:hypothetical protein